MDITAVDIEALTNSAIVFASQAGMKLLGSLAILALGVFAARAVNTPVRMALQKSSLDDTISSFLGNLVTYALYGFVILAAMSNLGIETTSFVAVMGAAGLAFGLALEGALGNLASGVLIAVFRPFSVGDWVECADVAGRVVDISIVTSTLISLDNETFVIPNGEITGGVITNYSREDYLRVECPVKIGYEARLDDVERILMDAARSCERVLAEPPPEVQVTGFTDTGLDLQVEVSCRAEDREDAVFDLGAAIKRAFDTHNVAMPSQTVKMTERIAS